MLGAALSIMLVVGDAGLGDASVLLFAFGVALSIVVAIIFVLAPLKLYSIDKTLKSILEELRVARAQRPDGDSSSTFGF